MWSILNDSVYSLLSQELLVSPLVLCFSLLSFSLCLVSSVVFSPCVVICH